MYSAKHPGYNLMNFAKPFSCIVHRQAGLFRNLNEIDKVLIAF